LHEKLLSVRDGRIKALLNRVKLLFKVCLTDNIFWNIPEVFRNIAFVFIARAWELEVIFALFRSKSHNRTAKAATVLSWLTALAETGIIDHCSWYLM
jgi:hypothetical protein